MALERGGAILGGRDAVEQRMADEGDALARARVNFGLERQHHGKPIGALDDAGHAAAPPGPDLRCDVVEHRHAGALGGARERHVELREIYKDDQVGTLAPQVALSSRSTPRVRRIVEASSASPRPAMSSVRVSARTPAARIRSPATPKSSHAGIAGEDLRGEVGAVEVA